MGEKKLNQLRRKLYNDPSIKEIKQFFKNGLFRKPIEINSRFGMNGETILQEAIRQRCKYEIIKFLLSNGAEVNTPDHNGNNAFMIASQLNPKDKYDKDKIEIMLIEHDLDVNSINKAGMTSLMYASSFSTPEVVNLLIKKGADVKATDSKGYTALHLAKSIENAEILIKNGADINKALAEGRDTPLLYAIFNSQFDLAEYLINNGADVNVKNKKIKSPLLLALDKGSSKIVQFIIEKGADVNIKSYDWPLLSYATPEIAALLISHGADINAKDADGNSALINELFSHDEVTEKLKILLEKGADVSARNNKGNCVMSYASREQVIFLLEYGVDIDMKDAEGKTRFINAINPEGNISEAEYFLKLGANINARDNEGNSALIHAIKNRNEIKRLELVEFLIDKGIDTQSANNKYETAFQFALRRGEMDLAQHIFTGGKHDNVFELILALYKQDFKLVKELVKKGVNLNDNRIFTHVNKLESAKYLLSKGLLVNIAPDSSETDELYNECIEKKEFQLAKLLLEKGYRPFYEKTIEDEDQYGRYTWQQKQFYDDNYINEQIKKWKNL